MDFETLRKAGVLVVWLYQNEHRRHPDFWPKIHEAEALLGFSVKDKTGNIAKLLFNEQRFQVRKYLCEKYLSKGMIVKSQGKQAEVLGWGKQYKLVLRIEGESQSKTFNPISWIPEEAIEESKAMMAVPA